MSLFGLDRPRPQKEEYIHLTMVHDPFQTAILEEMPKEANIPCLMQERGAGDAWKVILGYSMYGTDFFVQQENLLAAQEILTLFSQAADVGCEEEKIEEDLKASEDRLTDET